MKKIQQLFLSCTLQMCVLVEAIRKQRWIDYVEEDWSRTERPDLR